MSVQQHKRYQVASLQTEWAGVGRPPSKGLASKGNLVLLGTYAFLLLALVAGVLGFTNIAGPAISIARPMFVTFLAIFFAGIAYRLVMGKSIFGA